MWLLVIWPAKKMNKQSWRRVVMMKLTIIVARELDEVT
jgi:hypothetical protein